MQRLPPREQIRRPVEQPCQAEQPRSRPARQLPEPRRERRADQHRGNRVGVHRHPRAVREHQQHDLDPVRPVAREDERDDRKARLAPPQRQRDGGVAGVHVSARRSTSADAAAAGARAPPPPPRGGAGGGCAGRRDRRSAPVRPAPATIFSGCSPQRYWAARKSTRRSSSDTQAFGADRLRRCAQLSQSVALAASCAPHRPHSEYTRTPCAVTSRRIGRSIVTRNGSALAVGTAGARREDGAIQPTNVLG